LGGADSLNNGKYENTPLAAALPVYLDREPAIAPTSELKWELTREGWVEPWVRVRPIETEERQRQLAMPSFKVLNALSSLKPGAQVLAEAVDQRGNRYPGLVAQSFGSGRVATLAVGDLWRWGLKSAEEQADLASLYRARWNNELDLRSIKSTMKMDVLRCKTPELVRKEVWTHILAYNLIRTIMAQAATKHRVEPRTISFKGALQTLEAFQPLIAFQGSQGAAFRAILYQQLLNAIALHRVADRPNRFEPRKRKRPPVKFDQMMKPRWVLKREMAKGVRDN
jgi:hypothetical protein